MEVKGYTIEPFADLYGADLRSANLYGANLRSANLQDAKLPSPTMVLLAKWGRLSDKLTGLAMAYDAACHRDPSAFDRWVESGECPYEEERYQRACLFREKMTLWDPSVPAPRPYDLMDAILREKCKGWGEGTKEGK